jgi:hypothetical protein
VEKEDDADDVYGPPGLDAVPVAFTASLPRTQ